ncbi:hypothetical protein [Rothia sp. ZJ932]|uniref:hypothetical protein n=1 Tax=Rothia sp. ZJ932 TaxID=2810516 RepID=UPI001967BBED|nr:hypothetical protein [Rothia sp. ZJ932]QRZ62449.1 hypothetical protein JR346_05045 [Rothia sp. ZJ932]
MHNLLFTDNATPVIFRDLKWVDRAPTLVLETTQDVRPTGALTQVPLTPGAFLGFSTIKTDLQATGLSTNRYCAGYAQASHQYVGFEHRPCPNTAPITTGKQCSRCIALDEFSAMHGIHRGARLLPAAQAYASLDHWLYIATFPDGTSKIGTASAHSNPRRLDEQAVAFATFIGHANDGAQVRIWEDFISKETGLVQAKQARAKYKAWCSPLPHDRVEKAHSQAVALARWSLQEAALFEDFITEDQIIDQPWQPSSAMESTYSALKAGWLNALPTLVDRECGFYVSGATGKFLTVHHGDPALPFLVNLTELSNRALLPHHQPSEQPLSQSSLF